MPDGSDPSGLEAAQMTVLQMFGAVCAAPDDPQVRQSAEQALARLDELLRQAAAG